MTSRKLPVDGHGQDHPKNIVGKGCKKRPDQSPRQHGPEGASQDTAGIEQRPEIIESYPVKQDEMVVNLAVIGKGHADHKDQRQHGKPENKGQRRSHK